MKPHEKVRDELASKLLDFVGASNEEVGFFKQGFDAGFAYQQDRIEKLRAALKFYSLESNYSLCNEGRNYQVDYKCYELNEETYADEKIGTKARQALAEDEKEASR